MPCLLVLGCTHHFEYDVQRVEFSYNRYSNASKPITYRSISDNSELRHVLIELMDALDVQNKEYEVKLITRILTLKPMRKMPSSSIAVITLMAVKAIEPEWSLIIEQTTFNED